MSTDLLKIVVSDSQITGVVSFINLGEREREREREITIQYSGNYALPGSRVINVSAKNVTSGF